METLAKIESMLTQAEDFVQQLYASRSVTRAIPMVKVRDEEREKQGARPLIHYYTCPSFEVRSTTSFVFQVPKFYAALFCFSSSASLSVLPRMHCYDYIVNGRREPHETEHDHF